MESFINSLTEKDDVELVGSRVGRLNIANQSDTHPDDDSDTDGTGLFEKPTDADSNLTETSN